MSQLQPIACSEPATAVTPKPLRPLLFTMALLLLPHTATADQLSTETAPADLTQLPIESLMQLDVPKVSGASKYIQKTTEAPASVTVIPAEDISRFGYRTLADILQSAQGFNVSYDRNYSFLGSRGLNLGDFNSRILLLLDGHRLNNNLTDGAFIGNEFILDVDLIDHVEIIRGPGSALYGNNAFFDVINVVTRQGKQLNGFETSAEYGSFDTFKGRVSYGNSFTNGLQLLLSGTLYNSSGAENLFFPEYGTAHDNDGAFYGSLFASATYLDFTLETAFLHREKHNPTSLYFTTFNDHRLKTTDERNFVNLKFTHEFPDILDLTAQAYYDRNAFDIGYPFGPDGNTPFYKEIQTGQWWGLELQLSKRICEKHILSLGAEYRDDFQQSDRVFDPATGLTLSESHRDRQSHGVYAEADVALLDNLHFNAGGRYDQYGDFDPALNPRLALIYNPFDQSTLKAIYGTAFRAPNFLELSDSRFQDITPEEITSYELVYEQGLGGNLRSSVAGFYNRMDDLIAFQSGNYTNLDAEALGLELALEGTWASGIRGRASYTLQHVENLSQPEPMPDSPMHLVKVDVSVPLLRDKIFASLEFQYTSRRSTFFTTTTGDTLPGADVPGYGVFNFTLFSRNLIKNLEFSASVYNLLDQDYSDPATPFHLQDHLPRDGRTFRIKLTYRF